MTRIRTFGFVILFLAHISVLQAEDVIKIGGFRRNALSLISESKGFLKAEGIRIDYYQTNASRDLMAKFAAGDCDIVHTASDNVIAWAEGQGADKKTHDFIFFIGGDKSRNSELVVPPQVKGFDDLKGKVLAVDAINTGYAPVLVYILSKHGLTWKKDYELRSFGGGGQREKAVKNGEAFAALMSLDEELKKQGYYVLARARDYLSAYANGDGAARRDWAQQHEDLLVRYIRAMIRATDWTLDPKNKAEALQLLRSASNGSFEQAEQLYAEALDPKTGLIPRGKINPAGIQTVLEIRKVMGEMNDPLPPPSKYIDERYYQKAFATLGASTIVN